MTELNEIEESLREIDAATFQKLCDEYLLREKGGQPVPLGSQDGANKTTKGTPDTYILEENNKVILAEYTTQKNNLEKKINDDLEKIDESSIDKKNVIEIIYCASNSNITLEYNQKLEKKYGEKGIKFEFISNYRLSIDIKDKYRSFAKEYLGFELKPVQLKNLNDFANEYNSQFNGTKLDSYFAYRNEELKQISNYLKETNVILISGEAGIGKTKLAFEFAKCQKHTNVFMTKSVYDIDYLISETQRILKKQESEMIILDDANEIENLKKFLIAFLPDINSRKLQIIITVRDYAKEDILKCLKNLIPYREIKLSPLSSEQIKNCITKNYKVYDHDIINRVCEISHGNVRLSMLIVKECLEKNSFKDLIDPSKIFDSLFSDIIDKTNLDSNNGWTCLGLIAFLRHFNVKEEANYKKILSDNEISLTQFTKNIQIFDHLEFINYINDKYVNFSDQTLRTYVMKIVFLDKKLISLSSLIKNYFENKPALVHENILELFNTFFNLNNKDYIKEEILVSWKYFEKKQISNYLDFVAFFAFLEPDEAIDFVNRKINSMPISKEEISYKIKNGVFISDPLLKIIVNLAGSKEYEYASELLCKYISRKPQLFSQFYMAIKQGWKINYDSFKSSNFKKQNSLILNLTKSNNLIKKEVFRKLFLAIVPEFLNFVFEDAVSNDDSKYVTINHFFVFYNDAYITFRKNIWNILISIDSKEKNKIKEIIDNYGQQLWNYKTEQLTTIKNVAQFDKYFLLILINKLYESRKINDCIRIYNLNQKFNRLGIIFEQLDVFLDNKDFKFFKKLDFRGKNYKQKEMNYEKKIEKMDNNSCLNLLRKIINISQNSNEGNSIWSNNLDFAIATIFNKFTINKSKYTEAAKILLNSPFKTACINQIFSYLSSNFNFKKIYSLFENVPSVQRDLYIYTYFCEVPFSKVSLTNYNFLQSWLQKETLSEIGKNRNRHLDFLIKFLDIDKNAFENCSKIILAKKNQFKKIYFSIPAYFYNQQQYTKIVRSFTQIRILEDIYFLSLSYHRNEDQGNLFWNIFIVDPTFLEKYLINFGSEEIKHFQLDEDERLKFIINSNFGEKVLDILWNFIWTSKNNRLNGMQFFTTLFDWESNGTKNSFKNIDSWIKDFINKNCSEYTKMDVLFIGLANYDSFGATMIASFNRYTETYILKKPKIDDFSKIPLVRTAETFSINEESIKKLYNIEINELKELSNWIKRKGLDYFGYKKIVDERIKNKRLELRDQLGRLKANLM